MRGDYRKWLESKEYSPNTISTQCSHALRIEQAYGDLDEHYDKDRLEAVRLSFQYTADDGRRGSPNPSKIQVAGDIYSSLASFRAAVGFYRRFRDEVATEPTGEVNPAPFHAPQSGSRFIDQNGERIGLERDLQKALRREIDQLEAGLTIVDEGVERAVSSGYIDITARDAAGNLVIIELKAGIADRAAVAQILSYMGDVNEEESSPVRGILVAHDFDAKAKSAARMVPTLRLRSYGVRFTFADA